MVTEDKLIEAIRNPHCTDVLPQVNVSELKKMNGEKATAVTMQAASDIIAAKDALKALKDENNNLRAKSDGLEKDHEEKTSEKNMVQAKYVELISRIENQSKLCKHLDQKISAMQNEITDLKTRECRSMKEF